MPPSPPSSLERDIDALFAQPLADFVPARNALAARLKKEGRAEDSARVRALARPSISAWAVNQVYWHERKGYDRLIAAGDALRAVQQQMLTGRAGDLREAMRDRQDAVRVVVDHAMRFLRDVGNAATDATRQRVAVTVDALAAYGSAAREYAHGRLERDLDPPGLEALSFLNGLAPATPARGGVDTASAAQGSAAPARNLRLVQGGASGRAVPRAPGDPAAGHTRTRAERADRERLERERRQREKQQRAAAAAADRAVAAAERALERAVSAEREAAAIEHRGSREAEARRRQLARVEERLTAATRALEGARATREQAERALAEARERRAAIPDA